MALKPASASNSLASCADRRGRLSAALWMKPAPWRFARASAWTCNAPLTCVGATSRRHHLNPAEAHGRWRGRRAKPSGLLSVTTTHALLALKVQRKVSNGVAGLAAAGSSLDRPKIAAVPAPQRSTDPRASIAAEILALRPELRFPRAAAQA
jgi:hypothetical protein